MLSTRIVFRAARVLATRISGLVYGKARVVSGSLAGDRIVQPQRTLVAEEHVVIDQTTGSSVVVISDLATYIGIDADDLENYDIDIRVAGVDGSDMASSEGLLISHVQTGIATIFMLFERHASTLYWLGPWTCHLMSTSTEIRADAPAWAATETHSYMVMWRIYRLTDGIGRFNP